MKSKGDNYYLEVLCDKFSPLIKKYPYILNYDGCDSDLVIFFIKLIKNFPLSLLEDDCEPKILAYIKKSIFNEYVRLSKENIKLNNEVGELNLDIISENTLENIENKLLIKEILSFLNDKD